MAIVFAARELGDELQYLPELDVRGLGEVDAPELLGRRSPTVDEIADYLNLDVEEVLEGLEALQAHHAESMEEPIDAGQDESFSAPHDSIGGEDQGFALVDTSASLAAAIRQLRRADRDVLALRFRDDLKQSEIADRIGVSEMQVSRILRRATDQLRQTVDMEPGGVTGAPRAGPRLLPRRVFLELPACGSRSSRTGRGARRRGADAAAAWRRRAWTGSRRAPEGWLQRISSG